MNGAPNFSHWPDPVEGRWKQKLLIWLSLVTDIKILVETGTCEGATPLAVHPYFREIHTIELHPKLFEIAFHWIGKLSNVFMYPGASQEILPKILEQFPGEPLLFWLDAHASGPHTAQDNPLPEELKIITSMSPDALIVIDDQKDALLPREGFARPRQYPAWHREYRTGEILMHKIGRYRIPPFD
jgi:hypothetical protein